MSSFASVYVDGKEILEWRNEVDPTFLFLFSSADVCRGRKAVSAAGLPTRVIHEREEFGQETYALTSSVAVLVERLDALGISSQDAQELFEALRIEQVGMLQELVRSRTEFKQLSAELKSITEYTYDLWLADVGLGLSAGSPGLSTPFGRMRAAFNDQDARLAIRAVLDGTSPNAVVTLDVTELIDGGWLEDGVDPHRIASEHYHYNLAVGSPAVVITEGSTDARFLTDAIRVLRPHLVGYIKFLDYSYGNEGGAAAAVKALKAFAAAGITNRMALLLDHDSAGREAARALRGYELPSHFTVIHYPEIDHAKNYPTVGPTGPAVMDINGLAGGVELYLGIDVLTDLKGSLVPVQWTGYMKGVGAYQGEFMDKSGIQNRYGEKVQAAIANGGPLPGQDWADLETVLRSLISVLAHLG